MSRYVTHLHLTPCSRILTSLKDRYRELLMSYRQFSYIQAVRRFGQTIRDKLPPGSLAVRCPACPQPGINMDPNWESRPPEEW